MSAASLPTSRGQSGAPRLAAAPHRQPRPAAPVPYARERRVLGDPTPLACTVAKAVMEALLGGPALDSYARWIEPAVFAQVARQRSLARRAGLSRSRPVGVRRARVFRVSRDAAEVSIVVDDGDHCRAIAMRLEDVTGRWLVTEMHVG
ncbi:Rv3235 family protein [Demequina muriae]|uniref:Rv3235 family protein n=1 Tax=Demequina muriae TaxID=3051664 RepID=A0ABT8GHW6_9MICO|nr:Rv3235 family protein [Demequina sp. EGI L300058]MDN4481030.1 Rv3235 family protein [Demequina sp. EGI L300058]